VTRRRRLTLVAMCIAQGMTLLDVTIVNTALPSIQRELHMTAGQLEWVISAYALSLAAFIPLGGALGDRYGRKRFFLIGMVVFTLGSVACALSTSDLALIGSRALQGAGGALMSALTLAILTETYPVERRAGAFGMWAAISGLGFGLGPVVGGALLSVFSWSSVFWVNVPFAVAGFVIAFVAVTESRNPEGRALDVVGMVAIALGLLGITFGLIESSSHPWASFEVVGPLAVGAALVVFFVLWEGRTSSPMLPPSLLRARSFASGCGVYLLTYLALAGVMFYVTLLFQDVEGWSPLRTGLSWLSMNIPFIVAAQFAGRLRRRFQPVVIVVSGCLVGAAGVAVLAHCCRTPRRSAWRSSATCCWGSVGARWYPVSSTSRCATCPLASRVARPAWSTQPARSGLRWDWLSSGPSGSMPPRAPGPAAAPGCRAAHDRLSTSPGVRSAW
jgi:DHA2 family methylenomycin A resistance protein-like MFS transporter